MKKILFVIFLISSVGHSQIIDMFNITKERNRSGFYLPDNISPSIPTDFNYSNIAVTSVDLTWTASTDNRAVTGYRIYRSGVLLTTLGNTTSYTLNGLSSNTSHTLTIRAFDAKGNESGDSMSITFSTLPIVSGDSFELLEPKMVSTAVFRSDSTLLRSLTNYQNLGIGVHAFPSWDGLDNDGNDVSEQGSFIKAVAHNIQIDWSIIGNTSDTWIGPTTYRRYTFPKDALIVGDIIYYAHDYAEGQHAVGGTNLTDYQKMLHFTSQRSVYPSFTRIAYDGTYLYMAGAGVIATNDEFTGVSASTLANLGNRNNWLSFQGQTLQCYSVAYRAANVIDVKDYGLTDLQRITGLAVQTGNENLLIAREAINRVHVVHKTTGVEKQEITINRPKHIKIHTDGSIWLVHSQPEVIEKYTIDNSTGALTTTGFTITDGFENIQALTFTPDGNNVVVSDAKWGAAHQIFAYSVTTGVKSWTLGMNESYADDETVYNDKFMFTYRDYNPDLYGYLVYEADGSLWVNDTGNFRHLKFDASRNYVDAIMWLPGGYNTGVHSHDPTRVFHEMLEYDIDYSLEVIEGNANNAWTLKRNWAAPENLINASGSSYNKLKHPVQLSNGRTYVAMADVTGNVDRLYEMEIGSGLRDTGKTYSDVGINMLDTLGIIERNYWSGTNQRFYRKTITGFDASNNPIISAETLWKEFSTIGKVFHRGNRGGRSNQYTESGLRVMFDGTRGLGEYHIGAYDVLNNRYKFSIFKGIDYAVNADYPLHTATWDARTGTNGSALPSYGGEAVTAGNIIVFNHHGEGWQAAQTNFYHLITDEGIPLLDTGATWKGKSFNDSLWGTAGNAFGISCVMVNGILYVYTNDEEQHGGLHQWKFSNLESIEEFTLSLD